MFSVQKKKKKRLLKEIPYQYYKWLIESIVPLKCFTVFAVQKASQMLESHQICISALHQIYISALCYCVLLYLILYAFLSPSKCFPVAQ